MITESQRHEFDEQGFIFCRGMFPAATAQRLKALSLEDEAMRRHSHTVLDSDGRKSRLTLWYEPGDDVFGRLSCSEPLVTSMGALLGGEVSFFHAKLMNKEPRVGGKWEWHQDYGYWYGDGFMTADMGSCFVALDPCTRENGCLKVIPGSQRYGRLDHGLVGEQTGADAVRVQALIERHGITECTMAPGDALFFHSNLLHASGPNLSEHSRLGLITCFFRCDNESLLEDARYRNKATPLFAADSILDGVEALNAGLTFSRGRV